MSRPVDAQPVRKPTRAEAIRAAAQVLVAYRADLVRSTTIGRKAS